MGLSTKQVSSDEHGWNQALLQASDLELPKLPMMRQASSSSQHHHQEGEQLKCPRCESTNTKFCYYNNYNKSQPRHFCKACKRHWTKGGTLRNVPIGGGRKNKRKTSSTTTKTASKTTSFTTNTTSKEVRNNDMTIQGQQPKLNMLITPAVVADTTTVHSVCPIKTEPINGKIYANFTSIQKRPSGVGDNEKNLLEAHHEANVGQSQHSLQENTTTISKDGIFVGPQDLQYPYKNLGNFENISCSISSIQSPSTLYTSLEEIVMNNMSSSSTSSWSMGVGPTSNNSVMDINMSSNWGWDDFDKFVTVDADLITTPWDDPEIKP